MSDNRKYYYLKLKENYFDDDSIVLLFGDVGTASPFSPVVSPTLCLTGMCRC